MKIMKRRRFGIYFFESSKPKKSILQQIDETIAERKRILPEWEKLFTEKSETTKKDIHTQLKETISEFRKAMKQHESFFMTNQNKKAA